MSKIPDLSELKKLYEAGINITTHLKTNDSNSLSAIEIAYDLQAGSYTKFAVKNSEYLRLYVSNIAEILAPHLKRGDRILDCGTGEMTTLAGVANRSFPLDAKAFCFDLSLSRILWGMRYCGQFLRDEILQQLCPFAADIGNIPMQDNSMDVVWTSHALEPNYQREPVILSEIFRVAARKVVLFEPSYEANSSEGRSRMERLGYIRDLPRHIEQQGGTLSRVVRLENISNPLNPTHAYIIDPPKCSALNRDRAQSVFSCPVSKTPLELHDDCFYGEKSLLAYPIVAGIPILRKDHAIIASHYKSSSKK